jgi:prepilin-type processing-associated H-X9-DG protein
MFLFGDGVTRYDGYQLICDGDGELSLRDVLVTSSGPAGNPTASSNPSPGYCFTWDTLDRKRHRGRMNVVFADGHVESVPMTEAALSQVSLNKGFPPSDPN